MEVRKSLTSLHTPDTEKTYELSALIDVDSFFYAILDNDSNVVKIDHVNFAIRLALDQYPKLKSAKIAVANRYFTLVPEVDYAKESLVDYVQHILGPSSQGQYVYQADHVEEAGLFVCYAIPKHLYQYCFGLPSIPILRHQVSTLLSQINRRTSRNVIHVSRNDARIIIIANVEGQICLANTFESKSPVTTLYYISLIQEHIGVDKQDVEIEFSGTLLPGDETERLVSRYFPKLRYSPSSLKMDDQLLENSSAYFPLQSVSLCV